MQLILNDVRTGFEGSSCKIHIQSRVGKLNEIAVKYLVLAGDFLELPSALASLRIGLATLQPGLELQVEVRLFALSDPVLKWVIFGVTLLNKEQLVTVPLPLRHPGVFLTRIQHQG